NTSVKIYLSKSKITDLKNYNTITKYTKKLLNYSNVSKSNSLLYTSDTHTHILSLSLTHKHTHTHTHTQSAILTQSTKSQLKSLFHSHPIACVPPRLTLTGLCGETDSTQEVRHSSPLTA